MFSPTNDKATFTVTLPDATGWYLWGPFYYPGTPGGNDANSYFVQVDNGAQKKFGNNKGFFQAWHWDGNGDSETGAPDPVTVGLLVAGAHTVTVSMREVVPIPPRLDVVCLSMSQAAPAHAEVCAALPAGVCGTTSTTFPSASTTTSTTTSTLPTDTDVVCMVAATDPSAVLTGAMSSSVAFTGGSDSDPLLDNLTTPLLFANSFSNSFSGGSGDTVVYTVNFPSTGPSYLWGRFYYPGQPGSNDANSFFAGLDGGALKKFGNNKDCFQLWHWGGNGNQETGVPTGVPLGIVAAAALTCSRSRSAMRGPTPPHRRALRHGEWRHPPDRRASVRTGRRLSLITSPARTAARPATCIVVMEIPDDTYPPQEWCPPQLCLTDMRRGCERMPRPTGHRLPVLGFLGRQQRCEVSTCR